MRTPDNQRGAALVLIIGVIAAVAVMAASIVMLTGNVQSNTARDRTQKKAFNVTEAGLDVGQEALWLGWPTSAAPMAALTEDDLPVEFADASELPGLVLDVRFYDDQNTAVAYDWAPPGGKPNGRMYVVATGTVGERSARVQALVEKVDLNLRMRDNVALFTQVDLTINGGAGSNIEKPFGVDSGSSTASVYSVSTTINGNATFPSESVESHTPNEVSPPLTVYDILPEDVVEGLKLQAQLNGRDFDDQDAVDWAVVTGSAPNVAWIQGGGLKFTASDKGAIFSVESPGVLIVDGDVEFGGDIVFYGVVFCSGTFKAAGTTEIHGSVISRGGATVSGDQTIMYNQEVIDKLNRSFTLSVRIVPNTWREVSPDGDPAPE